MIANYHTHTWRCNHAVGREESYVNAALERNFQILGFADHAPYHFPHGYQSGFRMLPEEFEDYCRTVRLLQKKYAGQIQIPMGLELEYYPKLLPRMLSIFRDAGIEYLLLGQHFVGNEIGEHYSGSATADASILKRYCAQSADAMQTGLFTYFAHPDLFRFRGDDRIYRENMRLICREAKSCGMPLEVNLLGLWSGRNYPDRRFWELAAEEGCEVIIGCDAHAPEHLQRMDAEETALSMIRELGLTLLDTVPLRSI